MNNPIEAPKTEELKIDLGCGSNKKEGFKGVDSIDFPGVDIVTDLRKEWPFEDNSVTEAHSSHFIEHLTAIERVHFANELYRVLAPGGKCTLIAPHWASCRAYGDPTHQWPALSEFWFYYLGREWRLGKDGKNANAPHTDIKYWEHGFNCDFEVVWANSMHPALAPRNQEYQMYAMQWYKEAIQDMMCTLTKK